MRLFEKVVRATSPLEVRHPQLGLVHLPGASRHAEQVAAVDARYVLMDDMTHACGNLILDQPDLLGDCVDILRMPAGLFWVEWLNRQFQPVGDAARMEPTQRAGVLVHSEEGGRRGTMISFWDAPDGGADRCPAELHFDLDSEVLAIPARPCPAAYRRLYNRTEVVINRDWHRYYSVAAPDRAGYAAVIDHMAKTLDKDFAVVAAFSLMMSLRTELSLVTPDLDRLNRSRTKSGKQPLLAFTEVGARLFGRPRDALPWHGSGAAHSGARLHHVRGHFVRRKQKIFWRRTHLRGDIGLGIAPVRTTRLSL